MALAYSDLRHYEDAQDAVAAAIVKICTKIADLQQPERIVSWMQSIVRNEARQLHRRRRCVELGLLEDDAVDPHYDHTQYTHIQLRLDIETALDRLPRQQARVLRLHYLKDLSVVETAQTIQEPGASISPGQVKMLLMRGRRNLALQMEGYDNMNSEQKAKPFDSEASKPSRRAIVLHTDLSKNVLSAIEGDLAKERLSVDIVSSKQLGDFRTNVLILRDLLAKYDMLILDEYVDGSPAIEFVMLCKGFSETSQIDTTVLHSGTSDVFTACAYYAAGVKRLIDKDNIAASGSFRPYHIPWDMFNDEAKNIIAAAQSEAAALQDDYVSTEHLLLGLLNRPDSRGAQILAATSRVGLSQIKDEVKRRVALGAGHTAGDVKLTPGAMNVIDYAADEAWYLRCAYIGSEHMLLGMIRDTGRMAGSVLSEFSVELSAVREKAGQS